MPRYNNQQVLHAFNTLDSVFIEKVYNEMTPQIEHYLLKNGGRKENAADLIQEVYQKFLQTTISSLKTMHLTVLLF